MNDKETWSVFYQGAYNSDGSLYFPERLSDSFLEEAKKHQGSQFFANQYLNIVMEEGARPFRRHWLKYYEKVPANVYRYIFIDPAISQADSADFTAVACVAVDSQKHWYVEHCQRYKVTPTQLINLIFQLDKHYNPECIGIEDTAFQKVLVYMSYEEMERRNSYIPVHGFKAPTDKTKQMKILGLVPRFEWGNVSLAAHLHNSEFEREYLEYSGERSKHDDMLDALSSVEQTITYPSPESIEMKRPGPQHPDYEKWYRQQLALGKRPEPQGNG